MRRRPGRGFTLAEAMIAILFISIALFGYVSLHIRIIYSGTKLGTRQIYREQVGTNLINNDVAVRTSGNASVGTNTTTSGYPNTGYPNSSSTALPGQIPYIDTTTIGTPQSSGLPNNLFPTSATRTWTDHNGNQTYYVNTYERYITSGW